MTAFTSKGFGISIGKLCSEITNIFTQFKLIKDLECCILYFYLNSLVQKDANAVEGSFIRLETKKKPIGAIGKT